MRSGSSRFIIFAEIRHTASLIVDFLSKINGLSKKIGINIKVADYHQSAISSGSDAKAAAYIELEQDGKPFWGVGIHPNTTRASFDAIIVGLSKLLNT